MSQSRVSPASALVRIGVPVLVGALVTAAIAVDGPTSGGLPLAWWVAGIALAVNWLAFVPSWLRHTEHFYDLTGTVSYLAVVVVALVVNPSPGPRAWLVALLVGVWTLRLGSFLFGRVRKAGGDRRFTSVVHDPLAFLGWWTTQALWVVLTLAAGTVALGSSGTVADIDAWAVVGAVVWVAGFGFEAVADRQKSVFRSHPDNKGRYITTGLWAWSRHPNYFGEIVLWIGVTIIAVPTLSGWRWVALVSPVFVTVLLTRISGIPLLERSANRRWGEEAAYQAYRDRTPLLVPRPPR